jgi:hypothetical protein
MNEFNLNDEINQAQSLRNEASILHGKMFIENEDPKKMIKEHGLLLERLKEYENNLINFEVLNFLYATISRVALNSFKFKDAIQYAQAGIEANQKNDDQEGISANAHVLLDTACLMKAYKEAVKIIDKYPRISIAEPGIKNIKAILQNEASVNDAEFLKILNSDVRPKSLVICLDDKLRLEERAIKSLMLQMGITRKKALEYKKVTEYLHNN